MKIFKHELLEPLGLEQINKPEGRHYEDPSGHKYCSVTRFLDELDPEKKEVLIRWRKRVGEDKANQISMTAAVRGSSVHNITEGYVLNKPNFAAGEPYENYLTFQQLKYYLDRHVGTVYGVEHMLCSKEMGLAGTSDLICEWNGKLAIVDFKTSKRPKTEKEILSYFLQTTIYSMMVEENYGLEIDRIVILMTIDNYPSRKFEKINTRFKEFLNKKFKEIDGYKVLNLQSSGTP